MIKKIITLTLLVLISYYTFSMGKKEIPKVTEKYSIKSNILAKKEHNQALALWNKSGIDSYSAKIKYSAFSPAAGTYEIFVIKGSIKKWIHRNRENIEHQKNLAESFMIINLFEKAKGSYSNKTDSMFVLTAEYEKSYGYVKSINLIRNPEYTSSIPTDRTFRIDVIGFNIIIPGDIKNND